MAEQVVLREFLVNLGYKHDESTLNKFKESIHKVTQRVERFALAVEASAVAVAYGVTRWARSLEDLANSAIRTGTSATHIEAFDRAMQNLGAGAGEGREAIEALKHALNVNPAMENWIRSFGVQTRKASGELENMDEILLRLSESRRWQAMPQWQQLGYWKEFGLPENVLYALRTGRGRSETRHFLGEIGDLDTASRQAKRFMEDLRDLGTEVEKLGLKIQDALEKRFGVGIKELTAWLRAHGKEISAAILHAIDALIRMADELKPHILWLIGKIEDWHQRTHGLSTEIGLLAIAFGKLGGFGLVTSLLNLATAVLTLGTAAGGVSLLTSALGALQGALAFYGGYEIGKHFIVPNIWEISRFFRALSHGVDVSEEWLKGQAEEGWDFFTGKADLPRGVRNRNPGNLEFRHQRGATLETGVEHPRFAVFGTDEEGLEAMARQLEAYAGRGINTLASLLYAYEGGMGPDVERYIKAVAGQTGLDPRQKLNLKDPALLARIMGAMIGYENAQVVPYTRQQLIGAASAATGVQVTNNVTINVNGTDQPETVARAVVNAQSRATSEQTRNFATAGASR